MSRRGWLLFAGMSLVWGVPYLLIKVAVREVSPAELVLLRTGLAALVLLPIAIWRKEIRATLRHWKPLLAYTAIEVAAPWLLLGDAERYVTSSLTGLVIAGVPLVAAVMLRVTDRTERLHRVRVAGLLAGFGGVALLLGFDTGRPGLRPAAELIAVVLCYAAGPIIAGRWLRDAPSLGMSAVSLSVAALVYAPIAGPGLPELAGSITAGPAFAVVALALICTALAFVLFFALIAEAGAGRATVITFVNPVVAVALGAAVLDEPVTATTLAAFALIITGSILATRTVKAWTPSDGVPSSPSRSSSSS